MDDHTTTLTGLHELQPADWADRLERLPTEDAREILNGLPAPKVAAILSELPSKEAARLLEEFPEDQIVAWLKMLPLGHELKIRQLKFRLHNTSRFSGAMHDAVFPAPCILCAVHVDKVLLRE